jgi:hypothetical protein
LLEIDQHGDGKLNTSYNFSGIPRRSCQTWQKHERHIGKNWLRASPPHPATNKLWYDWLNIVLATAALFSSQNEKNVQKCSAHAPLNQQSVTFTLSNLLKNILTSGHKMKEELHCGPAEKLLMSALTMETMMRTHD